MGKMKRTAPLPRLGADFDNASNGSGRGVQPSMATCPKNTKANEVGTAKTASAIGSPAKSPLLMDKRKKKNMQPTSSTFRSPRKSSKGKEAMARPKKTSKFASDSSSSESSAAADDLTSAQANSEGHCDTEDNVNTSARPERRKNERKTTDREFSESACRKQLAALKSEDKRPPPPITAATFASTFCLQSAGINNHKLKIGRDITLQEVEDVFGPDKSKNGFALGGKMAGTLRKQAEKLYCLCYQKPFAPTHVAKEFAIGFVLDKVKHQKVNWAEFAVETNEGQRKSYTRCLHGCIQRLASVRSVPINELYEEECFPKYVENSADKFSVGNEHYHVLEDVKSAENVPGRIVLHKARRGDPAILSAMYY